MPASKDAVSRLRRSAFFAGLPPQVLVRMVAGAETVLLSRGQRLWSEGDRASQVGLVLSGRLKAGRAHGRREVIVDVAPFPGGLLIPIRLRRAELATLAATSVESVSRALATWQRGGILTVLPEGYLVRDLAALQRLAGGHASAR